MRFWWTVIVVFFLSFLVGAGATWRYFPPPEKTIPDQNEENKVLAESRSPKLVLGFFPYWNLDKVDELDFSVLTGIYYFAVDLNPDGSFNTVDPGWSRLASPGYQKLKAKAKENDIRLGVTIVNLDQNSIAKNVNNPTRRKRIIENTVDLMTRHDFVDLNIDLEYIGAYDDNLKRDFTLLVTELTDAIRRKIPGATVSLDTFADSVDKERIFDISSLSKTLDFIIIMGYDFHRTSSIRAGPVAPLFGKEKYQYDIYSSVTDHLTAAPAEKIVLGVPFYGYEWPVESPGKAAYTIYSPRGSEISSYKRSLATAKENNVTVNFDDDSKSAWFSYFDRDYRSWRQVWFENERSLGLKFDLVNQAGLAGAAIFALGYDGADAAPLWETARVKLR